MDEPGSISRLLVDVKQGDEEALAGLHRRYWPQLVGLARRRIGKAPLREADEEDVAQSAFIGFYETVRKGRAPELDDRHQLLALLSQIVTCKAINRMKREMAQKRGAGKLPAGSDVLALLAGGGQTPEQEVVLKDCYEHYMAGLDDTLREIAELHLAGLSVPEIADRLGKAKRSIERKLALLRQKWRQMAEAEE